MVRSGYLSLAVWCPQHGLQWLSLATSLMPLARSAVAIACSLVPPAWSSVAISRLQFGAPGMVLSGYLSLAVWCPLAQSEVAISHLQFGDLWYSLQLLSLARLQLGDP
ncbi:hypothetical protein NDU88_000590 [Pleurodeles waltl]|uniref:Uncharacterized protein n=1 Tax=Pleurodeles waltl TaxID=8319 RepID=A0AAV7U5V0_PLEWA|nr:hypothetical protein NDU88_000590 [Pleurodeles waltl]